MKENLKTIKTKGQKWQSALVVLEDSRLSLQWVGVPAGSLCTHFVNTHYLLVQENITDPESLST